MPCLCTIISQPKFAPAVCTTTDRCQHTVWFISVTWHVYCRYHTYTADRRQPSSAPLPDMSDRYMWRILRNGQQSVVGNEIIFVRCKGENIAKSHPVDCVDTTTHIICERNNQEKFGGIIEMVRTLVYGSFSYVFVCLRNLGNTMRKRRGYYWLFFFSSFFFWHYTSLWTLASSTIASTVLGPVTYVSSSSDLPQLPQANSTEVFLLVYSASGVSRESFPSFLSFLQWSKPCILNGSPNHLNLSILANLPLSGSLWRV